MRGRGQPARCPHAPCAPLLSSSLCACAHSGLQFCCFSSTKQSVTHEDGAERRSEALGKGCAWPRPMVGNGSNFQAASHNNGGAYMSWFYLLSSPRLLIPDIAHGSGCSDAVASLALSRLWQRLAVKVLCGGMCWHRDHSNTLVSYRPHVHTYMQHHAAGRKSDRMLIA